MARIVDETLIVDVSQTDWSEHPGWQRDFEASRLECKPAEYSDLPGCIHPREVIGIQRTRIEDGETSIERISVDRGKVTKFENVLDQLETYE